MKHILFVCTGNTCRSPMAEGIFNSLAESERIDAISSSSGIYANIGEEISANAKNALSEIGIVFSHNACQITHDSVKNADMIIGMTRNHAETLIAAFPEYADKIFSFPADISDPYGGNLDVYRKCRDEITEGIKTIINYLKENHE